MLPLLGEPIIFIGNSSTLVLSDHFWGANSDFCANFINQNSFCDMRENTPKSYGKSPQFCDFFWGMASLSHFDRVAKSLQKNMSKQHWYKIIKATSASAVNACCKKCNPQFNVLIHCSHNRLGDDCEGKCLV